MTQEEFKAWFDGFCEGIDKTPTEKQWKKIQARVKEINGTNVTERIFIDRYDPYRWYPRWYENLCAVSTTAASSSLTVGQANLASYVPAGDNFSSTKAMYMLGSAEAQEVA